MVDIAENILWEEYLPPETQRLLGRLDRERKVARFRREAITEHALGSLSANVLWVPVTTLGRVARQGQGMVQEWVQDLEEQGKAESQVMSGPDYLAQINGLNSVQAGHLRHMYTGTIRYLVDYHALHPEEADASRFCTYEEGSDLVVARSLPDSTPRDGLRSPVTPTLSPWPIAGRLGAVGSLY